MKHAILILILALAIGAFGCSGESKDSGVAKPRQQVTKDDGSTVVVNTEQGVKSEARTFQSGEVVRATRVTKPDGSRRGVVELRDGRTVELSEKSDIDSLMDASAESIKDAATVTWQATQATAEKVGEKTAETGKEVGKEIGEKTKQGAEATKDAAVDAAQAAGKGLKKAGSAIKNAGEKVKDKIKP